MENKGAKKRIRSVAAAAAAMSLALSFAYAEELGIDRAGFGTAVTADAAELILATESVNCGVSDPDDVRATYCYYYNENYGNLTISGNGDIDKSKLDTLTNKYKDQINGIVIENGITSIPENCFYGFAFPSLETVEIGSSVSKIGSCAFEDCGLSKVIFAENSSLEAIGERAFCNNNFTKIEFPDSVKTIEAQAFYNCSALESIEFDMFNSSLVSIGNNAFENCSSLKDLVIPNSVKTLGTDWISSVNGYIAYPENLFNSIPLSVWKNTVSFTYKVEDNAAVLTCVYNPEEKVTVPDCITVIGESAFGSYAYINVTNITLPDTITKIRDGAFELCANLKSINIPKNVTDIGPYAFFECKALSNVKFENGSKLSSIGESVFKGCKALTSIDIPQNVTDIGRSAFEECTALSNVNFEDGSKLSSINEMVFWNCTALERIDIPENVTKIEYNAFKNSGLMSVTIPKSVTDIGAAVFFGCTSLSNVNFEDGSKLSSIGESVFGNCKALESIVIPENVKKIEPSAFADSGLTSITIPKNITVIGKAAFSGCTSLLNVYFEEGSALETIGDEVFKNCVKLTAVEIPDSVDTIGVYAFDSCTSLETVKLPESTDLDKGVFSGCSSIKSIVIPDGIVSIEDYLFRNCTSLRSIELHPDIVYVGEYSFDGCTDLESIFIPSNAVTSANAVVKTASKVLYEVKDGKAYITEITLGDGRSDVAIPETICGFPVVFADENYRRYVGAHTHVTEKEKNCTEGASCSICGNIYTEALGHDDSDGWKKDADNHWKICVREGCGEQIKFEAHAFDNHN